MKEKPGRQLLTERSLKIGNTNDRRTEMSRKEAVTNRILFVFFVGANGERWETKRTRQPITNIRTKH